MLLALVAFAGAAQAAAPRYELANGCYALRSLSQGKLVVKQAGGSYRASATAPGAAEGFRMKATKLGSYLLFGRDEDFLSAMPGALPGSENAVGAADDASPSADWRVTQAGAGAFRLVLPSEDKALVAAKNGTLETADPAAAGGAGLFAFVPAGGCPAYPEVSVNASGRPLTSSPRYVESRGTIDLHMHMMAFEFLGGRAHCGKPWGSYGAPYALVDCIDHQPNGCAAVLENVLYGNPARCHDPVGWPTFKDWPEPHSLTHESSYYKWLERSWRGGLRIYVNLFVENGALCDLYPLKQNSCNEMDSVRLQRKRIAQLQNYIDAQAGGPGKGFFRIVRDPFQARRVINRGKLAVILGIEVSEPFGCTIYNEQPKCTKEDIDKGLAEVHKFGVRQMEVINKFDNAIGGVAGDAGSAGIVVNAGNKKETGRFWDMRTCPGTWGPEDNDNPQITTFPHNVDSLIVEGLKNFLPTGQVPAYPPAPHCNWQGLTELGEYLTRKLMQKKMIVDPDHLSVKARSQLLAFAEAQDYPGLVSSHSWSTPDAYRRILRLGGVVTPMGNGTTSFVKAWRKLRKWRNKKYYWGFGYGADMNGFANQADPSPAASKKPVKYPFRALDGHTMMSKNRSGQRIWDINVDGNAHYGLWPDWAESLRMLAGDQIVKDMRRGSESYLEMWERAEGVPRRCRRARMFYTGGGLGSSHLGFSTRQQLFKTGQPLRRFRAWSYCIDGKEKSRRDYAVFTPDEKVGLIASTARRHTARGVGRGDGADKLRGIAHRVADGLFVGPSDRPGARFFYGVDGGKVTFTGVATKSIATNLGKLRSYLGQTGLD